jgi:hypothetical protein
MFAVSVFILCIRKPRKRSLLDRNVKSAYHVQECEVCTRVTVLKRGWINACLRAMRALIHEGEHACLC